MNRLQKKCVIATAGAHLLLLLTILIASTGFFEPKPKVDDAQILNFIPSTTIDAAFNSGIQNATPPPPAPPRPPTPVKPTPPPPQPVKAPEPAPSLLDRVAKMFKPAPVKPAPTPNPADQHKVQPNLKPVVRNSVKPAQNTAAQKAIASLKKNLKTGTQINLAGSSTVAYANYATVVRSVYDQAWVLPDVVAKDENITVSVTIANDGTVISSRIVTPSGDSPVDDSVQKALDRVTFVAPFPEGSTDKERVYNITFNPQIKKSE